MRYRGAVNYYVNLPANPVQGDVWVVRYQGTSGRVPNGHAYCWENAPISSDKTYLGDVPAYADIVNHNPDIINWLKSKEQRDLAWAAFTFGYGIFFMTPNSSAYLNTESQLNKRGNFLYPLVFNTGSYLCFRKSQLAEQYTQYNADIYGFDYRDYNSIHKILDESSNNIYREYMSRTWSADASYKVILNGVTYNPYYFNFYNVSHSLSSRPDNGQPSYINWVNGLSSGACADVDIMVHGSIDQIQPANFVSNRLLLDVNGNIVQPGSSTYTYAYAGIEEELQWVDLGAIGQNLPTDKGVIYYNGICYSSGGGESGKFFHREEPETEKSNLIVLDNSTFTSNTPDYRDNIFFVSNDSNLSFDWTLGSYNGINNNIIFLDGSIDLSLGPKSSVQSNTVGGYSNFIQVYQEDNTYTSEIDFAILCHNLISQRGTTHIIGNSIYNSFIFGEQANIYASNIDNAIIIGQGHAIGYSGNTNGLYQPIILGAHNVVTKTDNVSGSYILQGYNNIVPPRWDSTSQDWDGDPSSQIISIGLANTVSGNRVQVIGINNKVGVTNSGNNWYDNTANYSAIIGEGNIITGCYESYILGYYNTLSSIRYSPAVGVNNSGNDIYETAIYGYDLHPNITSYSAVLGVYCALSNVYESIIYGYDTHVNSSGYTTAIGISNRVADGQYCTVLGYSAQMSSSNSYHAQYGSGPRSILLAGSYVYNTDSNESIVLGNNSTISRTDKTYLIGGYNTVYADGSRESEEYERSENFSDIGILGTENRMNCNTVCEVLRVSIVGGNNHSVNKLIDSAIVGYDNDTTNSENIFVFGNGASFTDITRAIRLGFYPLTNNDFFAIGDGYYDSLNEEAVRSSVFRIDANKNIYLNSTVPLPPVPSADGTYALNVASGASSWVTGGGGGSTVIANPSGTATDSLTKISIDNVIYSLSGSGTYVEANPSGTGSTDLTSVEIGSTIYNIPQGVNVVANPSGTASTDLSSLEVGNTIYSIPQGTNVTANPAASATDTLTKLEVGSTVYSVSGGSSTLSGLSDVAITDPTDGQVLTYDGTAQKWKNKGAGNTGTVLTGTLTAGSTTLTFSNAAITATSTIDLYTDTFGVDPTNISTSTGSVTLTFEAQASDVGVKVIIDRGREESLHTYSTSEHVVGTWVNGDILYEKTIKYQSVINASDSDIIIDTSLKHSVNCYIVDFSGVAGYGYLDSTRYVMNTTTSPEPLGQSTLHLPWYGGSTSSAPFIYPYSDGIHFMKNASPSNGIAVIFTVRYIKIAS